MIIIIITAAAVCVPVCVCVFVLWIDGGNWHTKRCEVYFSVARCTIWGGELLSKFMTMKLEHFSWANTDECHLIYSLVGGLPLASLTPNARCKKEVDECASCEAVSGSVCVFSSRLSNCNVSPCTWLPFTWAYTLRQRTHMCAAAIFGRLHQKYADRVEEKYMNTARRLERWNISIFICRL